MKLFSPTHRLRRKLTDCIAMVELVDNVLIDRDFVLSITLKSANLPRISNETLSLDNDSNTITSNNYDSQACMLTFYPRFEILTNSNEQIEIIFIVDVSNSMDGSHVQQAKQLAHFFLTNLKVDDKNIYFNVVTFGSDNDECFPISTLTTKENLDKAKHFVLHSLVHRGNTDLFAVLHRYSLLPSLSSSKFGRQFILLSDGHIHDVNSILALFKHQSTMHRDRLFTCAIGNVANKRGLKQLANGANGGSLITIFGSNYRSRWKTKVLNILEHVRQPCVTSISIDWEGHLDEKQKFNMQAPKIIRSLFNGMRLSVYRFIKNCHKATLTVTIDGQEFVTTVFSSTMTTTRGRILHYLTARAIIDDYENGLLQMDESENERIKIQYKQDLIDLSIKHSVISAYTSFVAIEERDAKTDKQTLQPGVRLLDVMLDRDVDLLPYMQWDGDLSDLTLIKQKLIDARISLQSASIQSKKELIADFEKLCEKISYRAGGDAKFDMMMTIIRTYRYSLNEYDKSIELENKMQNENKPVTKIDSSQLQSKQAELMDECDDSGVDLFGDFNKDFFYKPSDIFVSDYSITDTLLAASICTKTGKPLISRQFVEMTRSRIEDLLGSFPQLIGADKQHTFVETDTVRYVYQPFDKLYMILLTTKARNIFEDLEILRLFSQVISEYCKTVDEKEIFEHAFELISAFDEIVALGYKENVNLAQIRTYIEMDSHDERCQEYQAKDRMKQTAKELDLQKRAQRVDGSKFYESSTSISSNIYSSSSTNNKPDITPTPVTYSTSHTASTTIRPSTIDKAMKSEGEIVVNTVPVTSGVGGAVAKYKTQSISLPNTKKGDVHLKQEKKLTVRCSHDGGLESLEVHGMLILCVKSIQYGRILIVVDNKETRNIQLQTKSFPINQKVAVLKWRYISTDSKEIPLIINCWPNETPNGSCDVNVEYELQNRNFVLKDVQIMVPLPDGGQIPVIGKFDGDYQFDNRKTTLIWTLPVVDQSNSEGALEFTIRGKSVDFFPIQVDFIAETSYCDIKIADVKSVDNRKSVMYSNESQLIIDKYEYV
ncbi:unnamed protein product [Rotaria sordida]|uniref:Coatomer subunit delta n=1 Tax=Rotaria sordida TaxID=392033 RepID=A0A815DAH8_9BILA|nr:unnamed protein product [Rotaria sordida]